MVTLDRIRTEELGRVITYDNAPLPFTLKQEPVRTTSVYLPKPTVTATVNATAMTTKTVKVLDETGAPLPGANVYFNSTSGTTTDFDGFASLSNADPTKIVTISYMGFNSQSFRLKDLPSAVKLVPGETLGEVIVTAPAPKKGLPKYLIPAIGGVALLLILMSAGNPSPKEVTL